MSDIRDQIRAAAFNQSKASKIVMYAGQEIEVRQPEVGVAFAKNTAGDERSGKTMVVQMLIDYCYVPGTDEKVFDDADMDALLALPFNGDWLRLNQAINELTDLDAAVAKQAKN